MDRLSITTCFDLTGMLSQRCSYEDLFNEHTSLVFGFLYIRLCLKVRLNQM